MTPSLRQAAACSNGVANEEATDCESKDVAGSKIMSVVNTQAISNKRKSSSRPTSDPHVIDLISDNDSTTESVPVNDIMPSDESSTPQKEKNSIETREEETSGVEAQKKKEVWTDSGCLLPVLGTKNPGGTSCRPQGEPLNGLDWNYERGEFSPEQSERRATYFSLPLKMVEQKNAISSNTLKKRSASEVARDDTEALNCKKPKESTNPPPEAAVRSPPATAASNATSIASKSGDPIEMTEPGTEIGSCIYAQWGDIGWYFGTIYDVKRGPTPSSDRYSVFFHDGDIDDSMARDDISTMQDLELIRIEKGLSQEHFSPPPLKPDIAAKLEAILKAKNVPLSVAIQAMKKGTSNTKTADKFLMGRTFYRAWTDLEDQRKVVYGEVVGYEEDADGDVTACTVHYNETSRELMNTFGNRCGTTIPESENIRPEMAIGACLCYEEQVPPEHPLNDFVDLPFYWSWLTPDCVREEVVDGLPRVTMIYRGYKLELSVAESSIAGAGKGVFLGCAPVVRGGDDEQNSFTLASGELLDIGIYAPLHLSERKTEAVFTTKNFLHSSKSEEWAFHQFDTTDDITGDLRADAKARIQAYVNESNDEDKVCVYACNDPENCVHYMLGHGKETQRKFSMPADGRKREIFVNYGEAYEKVRVRKGYSFRPMAEQQLIAKELENADVATILHMNEFAASEVEQASNFLFDLFTGDSISKFTEKVIERALICAAVLRRRMRDLCVEDDAKSSTGDQALLSQSRMVVTQILKLSKRNVHELAQFHSEGDINGLLKAILERQQFSPDQRNELSELL